MSKMKTLVCASMCLFAGTVFAAESAGWKPLFNGKNLSGWSVHYASKTAAAFTNKRPPP